MAKIERVSKTWSVRKDLADRIEAEADARVVGQGLLVEKALESYLDALPTVDLTSAVIPPVPSPVE